MNEQEWNECTDPAAMMRHLGDQWQDIDLGDCVAPTRIGINDRQLRLFAVACCRQVWSQLTDPHSREAVEVAERCADGKATEKDAASAEIAANLAAQTFDARHHAAWLPCWAASTKNGGMLQFNFGLRLKTAQENGVSPATQAAIIRCIWNPFAPPLGEVCKRCEGRGINKSAFGAAAVECEHGYDVCPMCDACQSCKGKGRIQPHWLTHVVREFAKVMYQSREMVKCGECAARDKHFSNKEVREHFNSVCKTCHGEGSIPTGCLDPDSVLVLADLLEEEGCPDVVVKCGECMGLSRGNLVEAILPNRLACGSGFYNHAIVVSLDPFALVSVSGDMLWIATQEATKVRRISGIVDTIAAFKRWDSEKSRHRTGICPACNGHKTIRRPHPVIAHLRSGEKHYRGCWAVQAARGEE